MIELVYIWQDSATILLDDWTTYKFIEENKFTCEVPWKHLYDLIRNPYHWLQFKIQWDPDAINKQWTSLPWILWYSNSPKNEWVVIVEYKNHKEVKQIDSIIEWIFDEVDESVLNKVKADIQQTKDKNNNKWKDVVKAKITKSAWLWKIQAKAFLKQISPMYLSVFTEVTMSLSRGKMQGLVLDLPLSKKSPTCMRQQLKLIAVMKNQVRVFISSSIQLMHSSTWIKMFCLSQNMIVK